MARGPGPQRPELYSNIGPNYERWGEQPGYTYDPATDRYKPTGAKRQQQAQRPGAETNAAGLIRLGKKALDAAEATQAVSAGASSVPAGYAVASDGVTLINPSTGAYQVGTAANGGALMSDGTTVASEGASSGSASGFGEPSAAGYIGAGFEAYQGINDLMNDRLTGRQKADEVARHGQLAAADIYTLGLASPVYSLSQKVPYLDKAVNFALNPLGRYDPFRKSIGWGLEKMGMGMSTKARQQKRLADLYNENYKGQQDFINWNEAQKQQMAENPSGQMLDPNGKDAFLVKIQGKDTVVTPQLLWGEVAPMDIAKNRYFGSWNEQQRYEFNRRLLEEGLIEHKKGGFEINNKDRAEEIKQEINDMQSDDAWRAGDSATIPDPNFKKPEEDEENQNGD